MPACAIDENLRRLLRLDPRWDRLHVYQDAGFDLAQREHASALIAAVEDVGLVVLDTLTGCWSGDENDNPPSRR